MKITAFWFRRDLRLHDNLGLIQAINAGHPVLCFFIFDKYILDKLEDKQDARVQFIHQSISDLKLKLQSLGSDLVVGHGHPEKIWSGWLEKYPIQAIYTNRDYESYANTRDQSILNLCQSKNIRFQTFKDQVIFEKNELCKDDGTPYTVFTPYKNKWLKKATELGFPNALLSNELKLSDSQFFSLKSENMISLSELGFEPSEIKIPSSELELDKIKNYSKQRDYPILDGTSHLGIHLRFGTISIRELLFRSWKLDETFVSELIWRDFYSMILQSFPHVEHSSFKKQYDQIQWVNDEQQFEAWCAGQTGYPMVDAGMRELNATGFMHNRARMITASFLVKHLLIDWRWGEAYFTKKLLDFDLASNNGGWQWAAGSGTDAAPYFRIFNPAAQQKRFDPQYGYIKKWIPEFDSFSYPKPIIEHEFARKRCLEVYKISLNNCEKPHTIFSL
ncbi:MAG: deoxyribodipyrimidine photo-lyase [Saprospiraceae bacterium]|nr:deoxyribodipyrimidine photo-lyase [Saprospiraceae bacterium]